MSITLRGGLFDQAPSPDFYVDSVSGNDANDGSSPAQAFASIAAVNSVLANNKWIALARASEWAEQLGSRSYTGVKISTYGSGRLPILDGRNTISGSWTKTGGFTNLYQKTLTTAELVSQFISIWEDDIRLRWVSSQALADATPGRFYAASGSGTSVTVYLHASDGADPTSNGKTYKHSARHYGLITGSGWEVWDVHTKCSLHNDGSFDLGANSTAHRCLMEDGTKHNMIIRGGAWAYDCIAWKSDWNDRENSVAFVAYEDDATGLSAGFTRCVSVMEEDKVTDTGANDGFYAHTDGSNRWASISYIDCSVSGADTGMAVGNCESLTIERAYIEHFATAIRPSALTATMRDVYIYVPVGDYMSPTVGIEMTVASGVFSIEGLRAWVSNSMSKGVIYSAAASAQFTVRRNAMQRASGQSGTVWFVRIDGANSVLAHEYNVTYGPSTTSGEMALRAAATATVTSDRNVFYQTGMDFQIGSNNYTNFAAYRSANPALDANSASGSDPLFTDAANGDFSLQVGSPAIALGAGLERPAITYTPIPTDVELAAM